MAARKAPKPKKTSYRDFQNWLEGVKDMQEDNWIPSGEQWKRIQEKIELVDVKLDFSNEQAPAPTNQPLFRDQPGNTVKSHLPVFPGPAGGIPGDATIVPNESMPRAPKQQGGMTGPVALDPQIPVKTPDITEAGDYESPFT